MKKISTVALLFLITVLFAYSTKAENWTTERCEQIRLDAAIYLEAYRIDLSAKSVDNSVRQNLFLDKESERALRAANAHANIYSAFCKPE